MRKGILAATLLAAVAIAPAAGVAMMQNSDKSATLGDVERLVDKRDYKGAIKKADDYLMAKPRSADAYNYIGYSHRQLGDYKQARKAYDRALSLDPNHVGAHEYYGELHIKLGNVAAAELHLGELTRICGNCAEQQELAGKIQRAKAGG